jgi:hypothetical protein
MGMTIDDHIEVLKSYHHGFTGCAGNLQDSIDVAVDIMHKYQKIAELYDYWRSGKCEYTISCMENIGKVLRDGNDK